MVAGSNGNSPGVTWDGASFAARAYLWYTRSVPDHWSKLRIARRLGKYFFSRGLPLTNQFGARIRIDISESDFIPNALVYDGVWEPYSLALAVSVMRTGGTFLDIGSHIGLYACTVGALDGVTCVCIEPAAAAFLDLQQNLSLNPRIKATLVHAGVSSATVMHSFGKTSAYNSGTAGVLVEGNGSQETCLIACVSLDEVLARIKPEKPIRLLKIDVEGHELEVFKGIDWSGPFRPENVISEFNPSLLHRAHHSPQEFLQFFDERDYDAFTITGQPFQDVTLPPEENLWFRSRRLAAAG